MQENSRHTVKQLLDPRLDGSLAWKASDYVHPREVVQDDRLGPAEKRAILSAWASDACAVDSRPGFRWLDGTPGPVLVDHVFEALRTVDAICGLHVPHHEAPARRQAEHTRKGHLFAPPARRRPAFASIGR